MMKIRKVPMAALDAKITTHNQDNDGGPNPKTPRMKARFANLEKVVR
jgi:hypothetical protein